MTAKCAPCHEALWPELGLNVIADASDSINQVSLAAAANQTKIAVPADLRFGMGRTDVLDILGRQPSARDIQEFGYRFPQCQEAPIEVVLNINFGTDGNLSDVSILLKRN